MATVDGIASARTGLRVGARGNDTLVDAADFVIRLCGESSFHARGAKPLRLQHSRFGDMGDLKQYIPWMIG